MLMALGRYNAQVHEGLARWVRENDWELGTASSSVMMEPPTLHGDGVVTSIYRPEHLAWLGSYDCPVVRVSRGPSDEMERACQHIPMVCCDGESAGRLGAEHLMSLGKPHFAFYQQSHGVDVQAIRSSFVRTLRAAGHQATVLHLQAGSADPFAEGRASYEARRKWLQKKIRALPKPLAIMGEDDRSALELVYAVRSMGLKTPADVAILGANDDRLFHEASPVPISSVDTGLASVGYAAADLVAKLVDGCGMPGQPICIPSRRVFERESTAVFASPHQGIVEAMQFIRRNFREPLAGASVAKHAGMSLRGLQEALRQRHQPTLYDEILRLRIQAAKQLLEETSLELEDVARGSGLRDAKKLCRVFRQHCGMTPMQWRSSSKCQP